MALAMVGMPSVPSEQAFSVAGDIVTKKRNRMVGSTIKLLLLTKAWLGLPEVEVWEEAEETRGEDGNYEADTEGDGEPLQALDSGAVGRSFS